MGGNAMEEPGDLRLVGIADDEGYTWEGGDFFRGALGITASYEDACGGIGRVNFANGVTRLSVSGSRDRAGVENNDVGRGRVRDKSAALFAKLPLDSRAVGLGGAAAELLNKKGVHGESRQSLI